tara:strand:- start:7844 stop:8875 length:1032 start_codon:yes stop_codon:yes gene_type:complete
MASRPTVHDVAREAGVSLATVDRVLNARSGVRPVTARKVEEAMVKLRYERDISAANLSKKRFYRFCFILPKGPNTFMRGLEQEVGKIAEHGPLDRIEIETIMVPAFDGIALAEVLDTIGHQKFDGVAVVATESQAVHQAIEGLRERNIHVVTLVSDHPTSRREHFIGIDNEVAGRTAAGLLGRFCHAPSGKIAVIAGSMLLRDHMERRNGFEQITRNEYPHFSILPAIEGLDNSDRVELLLCEMLEQNSDIVALYSLGAGNRGVIRALEKTGRAGKIPVVAHELTEHTRTALQNGIFDAVINQDPGHEARSAVRVLKALVDGRPFLNAQEHIRIDIFMRDNLP